MRNLATGVSPILVTPPPSTAISESNRLAASGSSAPMAAKPTRMMSATAG
jgi:hypothetical protein